LTTLGERLNDDEVEQLLMGLEDKHGNVNYEEFVKMLLRN
jgi:Ca2+-binding EF-hand superfamily protein